MIDVLAFEPVHLDMIEDRAEQRGEAERFEATRGQLASMGPAFTVAELDGSGAIAKILCCAGLAEHSPTYATAWAYFAEGMRCRQWSAVVRVIRAVLDNCKYQRVDMIAREGFAAAHRFAQALGFANDATIYARTERNRV